ncbi:gas vesicle protein [Streptomyces sp. JJ36]|uniref:gas vesicle protein n=1 Tax=Streptomyces sp. JJ36 TaxID=2736645 RepID=UPI001F2E987F|nr:gas vesicle protein [Streptomyces sp. JJ36]
MGASPYRGAQQHAAPSRPPADLADILERVLDKGVVIAGDIQINLLDIELLTIKLRLLVASVDKAKEMGIDWWEHDPSLSSGARGRPADREVRGGGRDALAEENERLRARLARLEAAGASGTEPAAAPPAAASGAAEPAAAPASEPGDRPADPGDPAQRS